MDSFELNKITGAVLGTLVFVMGLNILSDVIYTPRKPAVPGYDLPAPEAAPAGGEGAGDQAAQAEPLPVLLASADVAKGQSAAKKCQACHNFDKGGPNKIGPNLWGVVGRGKGSHEGFAYSTAMKGKGGDWTLEDIFAFLANPKGYVPGTIMAFAGVSSPKERADIVDYLHSLADNPQPLPQPAAAGGAVAPAGAAPSASQTGQPAPPTTPGQRAEPGPAPLQSNPQSGAPQTQPSAQQQPAATRPPDPAPAAPPQAGAKPR